MSGFILKELVKGIVLRGENSDVSDNIEGSLFHNQSTKRLRTYIDSAVRDIITSSQAQTLTNKTIDFNQNTILNLPSASAVAFSNIVVAGQGTVVATAPSDSLNLVAGLNVTLVTDPVTKSVTVNSLSSGGGAVDSVNGQTGVVVLSKTDVGLGNVTNTSDADKPVSNATQTALNAKYDASNPAGYITSASISNKANNDLSNLTSTAIPSGINLVSLAADPTIFTIKTADAATNTGSTFLSSGVSSGAISGTVDIGSGTGATATGAVVLASGKSNTGPSGIVVIQSGSITSSGVINNTSNTSATGNVFLASGPIDNLANTNRSGNVQLNSGNSNTTLGSGTILVTSGDISGGTGSSGQAVYKTGDTASSGASTGNAFFRTGNVTGTLGNSGVTTLRSGNVVNGTSGNTQITTGAATGTGNSGVVLIRSGTTTSGTTGKVEVSSASPTTGSSGIVQIYTGATTVGVGNTGNIEIATGNSSAGNSGNIIIQPGTSSFTKGRIYLNSSIIHADQFGSSILVSTFNQIVTTNIDLLNISGTVYHKNLTEDTTFTFSNAVPGKRFTLVVRNATASSYTVTFPTVKQKAGTINNTVLANTTTIFEFVNSSAEYYCISCIDNMV